MPSKRAGVACAAVAVTLASVALAPTTACTNHQCDGAFRTDAPNVHMLDANTWVSSYIDEPWLPFNGNDTYAFQIPEFYGWKVASTEAYLSVTPTPDDPEGDIFVTGGGNIAEFSHALPDDAASDPPGTLPNLTLWVYNDTCAQYWLRVVVTAYPPGYEEPEAGAESGADSSPPQNADSGGADAADAASE